MRFFLFILFFPFLVADSQVISDTVYYNNGAGGWVKVAQYRNQTTTSAIPPQVLNDSASGLRTTINTKQPLLVSGATIKTINGATILGSGDISVSGGSIDSVLLQTKYRSDTARNNIYTLSATKLATNGSGSALTGLTASQVNLGNATNESKATMFTNPAFTGTPTGIGIPVYARVTGSNVTTTGQALVNITGLSIALAINAVYEFEAVLSVSTSAVTTGIAYGVNYSAAGATVEAQITGSSTSTASKTLRINALNTATTLYLATSAQTGGIKIKGIITTGVNAGNLTISHLKLTSGTSTVFINSFIKATRIN